MARTVSTNSTLLTNGETWTHSRSGRAPYVLPSRKNVLPDVEVDTQKPSEELFSSSRQAPKTRLASALDFLLPGPIACSARSSLLLKVGSDFFATSLSYLLGWWTAAHFSAVSVAFLRGDGWSDVDWPVPAVLGIAGGTVFTLIGHSEGRYHEERTHEPGRGYFKALLWSTALVALALCLLDSSSGSLRVFALGASAQLGLIPLMWSLTSTGHHQDDPRNVLIVGDGPIGHEIACVLATEKPRRRVLRGFVTEDGRRGTEVLGDLSDLGRLARELFVDELIIAAPPGSSLARRVLAEARELPLAVRLVPDLLGGALQEERVSHAGRVPLLSLQEVRIPLAGLLLKRALDLTISLMTLVALAPILVAIALGVRLDSPGPILYSAPRAGKRGRRFRCYKFRTMIAEADVLRETLRTRNQREGAFFKIEDDPRVTHFGRFLRRYSLDELPQLWNVVRGEMSLVGPRPHPLDDVSRYQPDDLQRLRVTPGLTGLWQVEARRDPSFARNIALDLSYISRWSLWLDLQILVRTLRVVLAGTGV